jgi:hypothetical protein
MQDVDVRSVAYRCEVCTSGCAQRFREDLGRVERMQLLRLRRLV